MKFFCQFLVSCLVLVFALTGCQDKTRMPLETDGFSQPGLAGVGSKVRCIIILDKNTFINESARSAILSRSNADIIKTLGIVNGVVVYLPTQAIEALSRAQGVIQVAHDILVEPTGKPVKPPKPEKSDQEIPLGVDRIDADLAWSTSTGSGVKVAILDTGIDGAHEDLIVAGGINVTDVGGPNDYDVDNNGHGTHLAGTIAALDNKVGVVGVAPDAELYAVKFRDTMYGWYTDAIDGIQWCIDNNMDVINMSFTMGLDENGVPNDPPGFHDAVIAAYNAGITMVCAPGNEVTSPVRNPAAYTETICTAGIYETGPKKRRTAHSFGTTGPEVDLAAPGCEILSTFPLALDVNDGEQDGYTEKGCGTSMSAAHGSGAVALVLELNSSMSPDAVKQQMKATAEDIGLSQEEQGAGLIDAEAAVQ